MTTEDNKTSARRFIDAFNRGDVAQFDRMLAVDFRQHSPGVPSTREAFIHFHAASREAFPDGRFEIEDMIAENDKVLLRWTFLGTHTGTWSYRPAPPTGRSVAFVGMDLWRFGLDGKLAEVWFVGDILGLMKQLGRIPADL
jgi:steroid delta-isomerase-like uncharacterized protein